MKTTKAQAAALALLRARLDPKHPMFAASREIEEAFNGPARLYLQSWVLPLIDFLIDGESYRFEGNDIQHQYEGRAAAAAARRNAIAKGMM